MAEQPDNIIHLEQYQNTVERVVATSRRKQSKPTDVVNRVEGRWRNRVWKEENLEQLLKQKERELSAAESESFAQAVPEAASTPEVSVPYSPYELYLESLINVAVDKFAEFIVYVGQKTQEWYQDQGKQVADRTVEDLGALNMGDLKRLKSEQLSKLAAEMNNVILEVLFAVYNDFELRGSSASVQQAKVAAVDFVLEQLFVVPQGIIAQRFKILQHNKDAQGLLTSRLNGLKAPLSAYIFLKQRFASKPELAGLDIRLPTVDEDQAGADLVVIDRETKTVVTYIQVKSDSRLTKPVSYKFKPKEGETLGEAEKRARDGFFQFLDNYALEYNTVSADQNKDKQTDRNLTRLCYDTGVKQGITPGWNWVFMPPNHYLGQQVQPQLTTASA